MDGLGLDPNWGPAVEDDGVPDWLGSPDDGSLGSQHDAPVHDVALIEGMEIDEEKNIVEEKDKEGSGGMCASINIFNIHMSVGFTDLIGCRLGLGRSGSARICTNVFFLYDKVMNQVLLY